MSAEENPEMTARFIEIFTRVNNDGTLVFPKEDQQQLMPVFILKIADAADRDSLPEHMQVILDKTLHIIGIEKKDSEPAALEKIRSYFLGLEDVGYNRKMVQEVTAVFNEFGVKLLEDERTEKGEAFNKMAGTEPQRNAPKTAFAVPLKLNKKVRRGISKN
ncbi:MAG: hypothetical protein GY822_04185 [Deltaproteobacteria bacterium]|nr:hypothetical protein [Deltaproteobacteria bacterium]